MRQPDSSPSTFYFSGRITSQPSVPPRGVRVPARLDGAVAHSDETALQGRDHPPAKRDVERRVSIQFVRVLARDTLIIYMHRYRTAQHLRYLGRRF